MQLLIVGDFPEGGGLSRYLFINIPCSVSRAYGKLSEEGNKAVSSGNPSRDQVSFLMWKQSMA